MTNYLQPMVNSNRADLLIDPAIRYANVTNFKDDLKNACLKDEQPATVDQNIDQYVSAYKEFMGKIVSEVKSSLGHSQPTMQISLQAILADRPLPNFHRAEFECVIRHLYREYGIIVKTADSIYSPDKIEVASGQDCHKLSQPSTPFSNNLIAFRKSGEFCDFKLKNANEEGTLFPCHKLILSAGSAFFNSYFTQGFSESQAADEYILQPSQLDGEPFTNFEVESLLDYIYSGHIELSSLSVYDLSRLLELASYFDLPSLREECISLLGSMINDDNAIEILRYTLQLGAQDLFDYYVMKSGANGVYKLFADAIDREEKEVMSACLSFIMPVIHRCKYGIYTPDYQDHIRYEAGPKLGIQGLFEVLKSAVADKNEQLIKACIFFFEYCCLTPETHDALIPIAEYLKENGHCRLLEACQKLQENNKEGTEKL